MSRIGFSHRARSSGSRCARTMRCDDSRPLAMELGCSTEREQRDRRAPVRRWRREARRLAEATSVRPEQAASLLERAGSTPLPHAMRLAEIAKRQNVSLGALFEATGVGEDLERERADHDRAGAQVCGLLRARARAGGEDEAHG